jgi:outer membrane protein assembly factor BamE (lipoprotein component of BamABCDE complex)
MKSIFFLLFLCFLFSCTVTQQNLNASHQLNPGMTKDEVVNVMGSPIMSDFYKNVEEWHYCKTGFNSDQYLALFFHQGKLVAKKSYTVTLNDTRGVSGSCENFTKRGNYREPDEVKEIRLVY